MIYKREQKLFASSRGLPSLGTVLGNQFHREFSRNNLQVYCLLVSPSGAVRASSIFPIMSVGLLFMGGLCVAASEFYRSRHNVILSAGIFFVSAGKRLNPLHQYGRSQPVYIFSFSIFHSYHSQLSKPGFPHIRIRHAENRLVHRQVRMSFSP